MKFTNNVIGAVFFAAFLTSAQATTITADVIHVGGSTWEYTYSVSNDSLSNDIDEFTIFFDLNLFENLVDTSTPEGWDPLIIQPDPALPDDGFYDVLALTAGIAPGGTLGGFGVQFDFQGTGTPGTQTFYIVDPSTFAILDSGLTQVTAVPVPAAVWLFGSGLMGLIGTSLGCRRRRSGC